MQTLTKKSLFWDAINVDSHKNEKFIIDRILNYGDESDFRWAREIYGDKKVSKTVMESRVLDDKSLSFWCQYFKLDKNKCLKNQSAKKRSWFWKR
ncbi:MAG TPA: hypothetical protein DCS28_00160 [Candidatus Moranbacteria bacterium]|nr:hypothetical protein [Candidatus Moranbacteria bacterium]